MTNTGLDFDHNALTGQNETTEALLIANDLSVSFRSGAGRLRALDGVSISVSRGQTVALVGESGSGKTTAGMTIMRAHQPDSGQIFFGGQDITRCNERRLKPVRRRMQMILQNPYASLDPRMSVERIIGEPLVVHTRLGRAEIRHRVEGLLEDVGLGPDAAARLPSQFSGGQRQRIAIARALAVDPELVVADEPVSALDVSIQAQITNLLMDLQRDRGLAYLVISHDLALVHHMADHVVVLYLGRVVESGSVAEVIERPQHPYTAALLSASPSLDVDTSRERIVLGGEPASAISRPSGCSFHPRCPIARERCKVDIPPLVETESGSLTACFYPGEMPGISPIDYAPPRIPSLI